MSEPIFFPVFLYSACQSAMFGNASRINRMNLDQSPGLMFGQPSDDLLPVDLFKRASDAFFAEAQPADLNYGPLEGDERFLAVLADCGLTLAGGGTSRAVEPAADPR